MLKQEWIGIQFNLDEGPRLKSKISQGIEFDGDHITVQFGKNELKKLDKEESEKVEIIKKAIKKYLNRSDYTNIYSHFDADELENQKSDLKKGKFKESIRVDEFNSRNSILENFDFAEFSAVRKLLKKNKMIVALNQIFEFVLSRNFETEQKLTLEITYEDKEEWGSDTDNINVSIQLEKL